MSDHLPECIYKPENIDPVKGIRWGGSPCVCDQLRAIEQRVRQETADRATIHLALHGWHPDDADWVQRFRAAL